jgi:hypothetical protein
MNLPSELYSKIFTHLQLNEFFELKLISGYFNQIIDSNNYKKRIKYKLNLPNKFTDISVKRKENNFERLLYLTNLESIDLSFNHKFEPKDSIYLRSLRNLKRIDLSRVRIDDSGVQCLVELQKLEDIKLTGCRTLTDVSLQCLGGMKGLKKLDISFTGLNLDSSEEFCNSNSLIKLNIEGCNHNSVSLKGIKNLKSLITDRSIIIRGLINLEKLILACGEISQELMNEISGLTKLKKLTIVYSDIYEKIINVNGPSSLEVISFESSTEHEYPKAKFNFNGLDNLKRLNSDCCSYDEAEVESISNCAQLRSITLNLFDCKRYRRFKQLSRLKHLEEMIIYAEKISDVIMTDICSIVSLKRLESNAFSNRNLKRIKRLINLEELDLHDSPEITADGINKHLNKLPSLKKLNLKYSCIDRDDINGFAHTIKIKN